MKDVFKNKKLWIGIGCGILAVVLVVGIILMAGGNGNTNTTNPTTEPTGTTASGDVTDPSDVTDPEDPTWYPEDELPGTPVLPPDFGLDDPTEPSEDDTDVEIIAPSVEADDDEGPEDPDDTGTSSDITFEGDSYVGNPDDDDETVVDPNPTNPTPSTPSTPTQPQYDFGDVTAGTITYEIWSSWDHAKQQAWENSDASSLENATPDERYNYYCAVEFQGGYDCGYENHYCTSKQHHDHLIASMAEGCPYCGSNDCVSFYARDKRGITMINFEKCPQYNDNCEVCGLPESRNDVESGEAYCNKYLTDTNCHECGEPVKAGECHREIKP